MPELPLIVALALAGLLGAPPSPPPAGPTCGHGRARIIEAPLVAPRVSPGDLVRIRVRWLGDLGDDPFAVPVDVGVDVDAGQLKVVHVERAVGMAPDGSGQVVEARVIVEPIEVGDARVGVRLTRDGGTTELAATERTLKVISLAQCKKDDWGLGLVQQSTGF